MQDRKNVAAWASIGGKTHYYKSNLERCYAVYLELLKRGGEIQDWWYEPRKFRFFGDDIPKHLKGKTQGSTVYTPDFKTLENDDSILWHESKGHLDNKDFAKMRAFHTYYPNERLVYVVMDLPKGRTQKSLNRLMKARRLRDELGFELREIGKGVRRHKKLFNQFIHYGK